MTDKDEIALAKRLPKGSRRCLMALTTKPTHPGKATFNANAAFNLHWTARKHGGLSDSRTIDRRAAYYITPLGERIRERLIALGMEARRVETNTDSAPSSDDSPVRDSECAQTPPKEGRPHA